VKSFRRKLAASLLADLLAAPAENAWVGISENLRAVEGPGIYERELIPGFTSTRGESLLWKNPEEEAEESMEEKARNRKLKKMLLTMGKVGSEYSAMGGDPWQYGHASQHYFKETNPPGRDYSERRERDNQSGAELAWDQVGESFYRDSDVPEPPLLNQHTYSNSRPATPEYKQAEEWGTTESQKRVHKPVSEGTEWDSPDRKVSDLFEQNQARDPMTPEEPGSNFRGSPLHYATPKYALTMNHPVWQSEPWTTSNDEKTEHARLPGKKPVVRDSLVEEGSDNVWEDHDSFQHNKGIIENTPATPGPSV